jgi:hypothetical protein
MSCLTVATLVARNVNEPMVTPMEGGVEGAWSSLGLAGFCSLESRGQFCVCAFGRNLVTAAVKMVHFNLLHKNE